MTSEKLPRLGWLFPARPRDFAGRRGLKIVLRAVHLCCAGILVGAVFFDAAPAAFAQWLLTTVVTGLVLLALDLHESAAMLFQVRGAIVVVKLAAAAVLPWLGPWQLPVLVALMFVACISSHAPASVRYYLLLGRDFFAAPTSKG